MKKTGAILACVLMLFGSMAQATTVNDELLNEIKERDAADTAKQIELAQANLNFETFKSCEDMQMVLEKFLRENADRLSVGGWGGGRPMPLMAEDAAVRQGDKDSSESQNAAMPTAVGVGGGGDYSQTNIQVAGVDEPDILKSDGTYLYYYNQRLASVFVIKAPLQGQAPVVVSKINLPEGFWNIQLLLEGKQLALLSQRWKENVQPAILDTSSRVDVAVYNVEDPKNPKLDKLVEFPGYYTDARLRDGNVYIVSQLSVNRWMAWNAAAKSDTPMINTNDVLPKQIDISYTKDGQDQNLTIGNRDFPYRVSVETPDCANVYYTLPTKETMDQMSMSPQFTTVYTVDLDTPAKKAATTVAFGGGQTIYMSPNNLYVTTPLYTPGNFACPFNARCLMPAYRGGEQTIVHKFALDTSVVRYNTSSLVQGSALSQWSMDEDSEGYFRILTRHWMPEQSTDLYILDAGLKLHGSLMNIEPGEDFKASRYIGDKLYLVTFQQIDPLFVIDIKDKAKPKIIGELEIPGYSTYLHPYAALENNVQYLVGLGYDTMTGSWGGTVNGGIKVDLYKVDYNDVTNGQVKVSQIAKKVLGSEGSRTEAQYNPRAFVWDNNRKQLSMPVVLAKQEATQSCTINYDRSGKEIGKQCYPNYVQTATFAGIKVLSINPQEGIQEVSSRDYKEKFQKLAMDGQGQIQPWFFQNRQARAGYVGGSPYLVTNYFVDGLQDTASFVTYDDSLTKRPDQCIWTKPAAGEATCDMYCGKRWIRQDNGCQEVDITSGCSCPGYDTKTACENICTE